VTTDPQPTAPQSNADGPNAAEPGAAEPKATASEPAAPLLDDSATADLSAKVAESWEDFTAALGKMLAGLAPSATLEVTVDQAALEGGRPIYEVSATCPEAGQLRAFAVGNNMLPETHRLTRTAVAELVALGWSPPGASVPKDERYSVALAVGQAGRLATILTRTLRDVYGAPHPAFLMYEVQGEPETDTPSTEPVLGAARALAEEDDGPHLPAQADLSVLSLPEQVATVLAAILRTTPEALPVDNDGDYGIRSGSAMVFVRVRDDPPLVDVFSPVLTEVNPSQPLFAKLSELTARLPIGRLYFSNKTVWASVPVIGRSFQATHLMLAVQVMTGLADELDDRLHGEFGGRRFFVEADRTAAAGTEDGSDDGHTGMYL
jgi:hypothetical protein